MIGCLFQCKEEGMPLIMENNISQIATTATLTGPFSFYEIFNHQIAKWLLYAHNSFVNSIFEALNRRWAVGVDLSLPLYIEINIRLFISFYLFGFPTMSTMNLNIFIIKLLNITNCLINYRKSQLK